MEKKMKQKKEEDVQEGIEGLPDPILQHILSFLDTKECVGTSVLSKRWQKQWTCVSNLRFVGSFADPEVVKNVLSQRSNKPELNTLTYEFDKSCMPRNNDGNPGRVDPKHVGDIIRHAVHQKVKELSLRPYADEPFRFPECFFGERSLTVLKLDNYYEKIAIPSSLKLPCLKELHLLRFSGVADRFISSCPNLKTLVMYECDYRDWRVFAPQIGRLEILYPFNVCGVHKIEVHAPKITSFKYEGMMAFKIIFKTDLPSIEDAHVDLRLGIGEFMNTLLSLNLVKLLRQLGNVKYLTISLKAIEVLQTGIAMKKEFLPYLDLKHLKVLKGDVQRSTLRLTPTMMNYFSNGSYSGENMVVEFVP